MAMRGIRRGGRYIHGKIRILRGYGEWAERADISQRANVDALRPAGPAALRIRIRHGVLDLAVGFGGDTRRTTRSLFPI